MGKGRQIYAIHQMNTRSTAARISPIQQGVLIKMSEAAEARPRPNNRPHQGGYAQRAVNRTNVIGLC